MRSLIPANEARRLAALEEYQILDTEMEQSYDDITALAAHICKVPVTMISLVDSKRQWFKSKVGMEPQETPRDIAFCAHAILDHDPLIVRDTTKDRRFARNPLVKGEPHIRFYAGFPLINPEGLALGTLCAVDRKPHQLSAEQQEAMLVLARQVMVLMEFRRVSGLLADSLDHVKMLQGLLPICSWCKRIRNDEGYWARVEACFHERDGIDFSHGICPECMEKLRSETALKQSAA
jgi:GAF domain-containing protein